MSIQEDPPVFHQEQNEPGIRNVWTHFMELSRLPRPSGDESIARNFIIEFANERQLSYEVDGAGNVLVEVPATVGYEQTPGVVLQAHLDMVCLGEPNPAEYGVQPVLEERGEWLHAQNTTLGADNGIGLSVILALADEKVSRGPLALMFTTDEEVGLKGALKMGFQNKLKGYRFMLNFDSEKEGEATISSAGAGESTITLPVDREDLGESKIASISVSGLPGGHSGVDIHEKRLNGIKVLSKVLDQVLATINSARIVHINGGTRKNVIPSEAELLLAIAPEDVDLLSETVADAQELILKESDLLQKNPLQISWSTPPEDDVFVVFTPRHSQALAILLRELPHGVIQWSSDVKGLVQTSTNLATIHTEKDAVRIEMMSRSSINEELTELREVIVSVAHSNSASVEESDVYPGWQADPNNPLIPIVRTTWHELTGKDLEVLAVHAGLECGLIVNVYPQLSAISIGPTIEGAHTIQERVNIASVATFYRFARNILSHIAEMHASPAPIDST